MKKTLLLVMLAMVGMLFGCAGPHGSHGCMSTVNNWYKEGRTRWQTSTELTDCARRSGGGGVVTFYCNGTILEDCMKEKGYAWFDGMQNPRDEAKRKAAKERELKQQDESKTETSDDDFVFVFYDGRHYHNRPCPIIKAQGMGGSRLMKLQDAIDQGFTPCPYCIK